MGVIMSRNENSFLDSKTITAIVLVGLVWFGWQNYLSNKYPKMHEPTPVSVPSSTDNPGAVNSTNRTNAASPQTTQATSATIDTAKYEEKMETVSSPEASFEISSVGMGIKNLRLAKYTKRDKSAIEFAPGLNEGIFEMRLLEGNKALPFHITKKSDTSFEGRAQVGDMTIVRTIDYSPETYSFKNTISVLNAPTNFKGIVISVPEKREQYKSGGFLIPSYDHQEFLVAHSGNKTDTTNVSSAKDGVDKVVNNVSVVSVASQYFASAVADKSEIAPEVRLVSRTNENLFQAELDYKVASVKDKIDFNFVAYSGPKSHETLEKADPELGAIIDLGIFAVIGRVLLSILKWFNVYVGNWGFSIILLTLLVRAIVLPFNIASYKSMKKMQRIQPLMQALRQRYKDEPQTLQRETMALMKQEKANPIGGCLPMLLQMPIFFALFRVLGQSIDLYQAPFVLWITDLSLKDPFYVLPVLMGVTLFIQQKITPSTMDPKQAKIMQFMPIIFSFMMISLPSGLTLYTFVSTLFGILQQRFFMRDRTAMVRVKEAKI
jgi:YidC/Oxa1 family membrane protein insertase